MNTEAAVATRSRVWPDARMGEILGYAGIWSFFIIFLIYPLTRLFYDSFTTDDGIFTLGNYYGFFTDGFYLRSFYNSMVLGVACVITTSVLGIAIAFLLLRYDFPGRRLFSYLTIIPMIMPPLVGVMGFTFILGAQGRSIPSSRTIWALSSLSTSCTGFTGCYWSRLCTSFR